jgi:hypothetical protein
VRSVTAEPCPAPCVPRSAIEDQPERAALSRAEGGEPAPVERQQLVGFERLGKEHQRRVGEVHGHVRVAEHEGTAVLKTPQVRWYQQRARAQEEVEAGSGAAPPDEVHRFGENGLGREQVTAKGREHVDALLVRGVMLRKKSDEGALSSSHLPAAAEVGKVLVSVGGEVPWQVFDGAQQVAHAVGRPPLERTIGQLQVRR